jgi:RNA polymerase sigma factor (sigma-70 family)
MSPSISIRLLGTQSDARLLEYASQGHERAFEALVLRYRRQLLAYCRRLLLTEERAEDALQQGLLRAWLALQNGTDVRDPKAWIYTIVHNAALNTLRESGYDYAELHETLSGRGAPEEDLDRRIAVREALAGLAALPELQREALMRTAVEGESHHTVAAELLISEGALRGLVYRARATLRAAATAVTPTPLVTWAASPGAGRVSIIERFAELGAGAGTTAGLGGLLLKGGAVAVTAGVLVSGVGPGHLGLTHHHAAARSAHGQSDVPGGASGASADGAVAAASAGSVAAGFSATSPGQGAHRLGLGSSPAPIAFVGAGAPSRSSGHGGGGRGSDSHGGSGSSSGSGDGHGGGSSGGGGGGSDGSASGTPTSGSGGGGSGSSDGGSSGSGSSDSGSGGPGPSGALTSGSATTTTSGDGGSGSGGSDGGSGGSDSTRSGSGTSGSDGGSNPLSPSGSDGGSSTTTPTTTLPGN